MSLFKFSWLRRLVRRNTAPMPEERAALWKQRLSLVYMLIAWNAFGFVCYMIYQGKSDWVDYYGLKSDEEKNMTPGQRWVKTLGTKSSTVYRVSGLKVTREDYNETDEEKQTDNINTEKIN